MNMVEANTKIRDLETQRAEAMRASAVENLGCLLDDRLVYTHSNGSRETKAAYLRRLSEGALRYIDLRTPIEHVSVLNGVAVVVGEMDATVEVDGRRSEIHTRTLAIWCYSQRQWRLVAFQGTPRDQF